MFVRILFIVNPIAGTDKAKSLIPLINYKMNEAGLDYKIITTSKPKEAIQITRNGIKDGYDFLAAVGGDGTINEVAMGIMLEGHGILGIIPGGTGNDLARSLNIPIDPEAAIDLLIKGKERSIDIGTTKQKLFLNVGSVGFDSEIVKNTEAIKKYVKSKFAYTIGLLKTLLTYKFKKIKIELDNIVLEKSILLVAVGNGNYYGGGMKICPMAIIDDGYFHVCVINKINKLKLFSLFPLVFNGRHQTKEKYVEFYKSKHVKISFDEKMYLNLDGEIFYIEKELFFSIGDKKIDIICSY